MFIRLSKEDKKVLKDALTLYQNELHNQLVMAKERAPQQERVTFARMNRSEAVWNKLITNT